MRTCTLCLLATLSTTALRAASIDQVIVRQQWPWSTDVKIEYRLSGVTGPVDVRIVEAYDGATALDVSRINAAARGDIHGVAASGTGAILIDAGQAFDAGKSAVGDFRIRLGVVDSPANVGEVLYKIVDMTTTPFAVTDVTRADLLNGKYGTYETTAAALGISGSTVADVLVWTGVTNNPIYKTDRLVLRKIPAKGQTFCMGTPEDHVDLWRAKTADETAHDVTFTNDFWAGVFELTQKQFRNIMGYGSGNHVGETFPAETISYVSLRGADVNWPTTGDAVGKGTSSDSVLLTLRKKAGNVLPFDLPTEAMWEFACSAGTAPCYVNDGSNECASSTDGLGACGWFNSNSDGTTHEVGLKRANAYGLYDMHGNVMEWCLDWKFEGTRPAAAVTDPAGAMSGTMRICRGGYCSGANNLARTQALHQYAPATGNSVTGVRIFCRIPNGD